MNTVIIKTQAEYDKLPKSFPEDTTVEIRALADVWIRVNSVPSNGCVVASGSSHVEAWGSSHVVAWGSSHVEAWESSHVEASGSSHVEAWGQVSVHLQSDYATVVLFMFAVCFAVATGKIVKKSRTATIVKLKQPRGTDGWLTAQAIKPKKSLVLFKKVSKDFYTQEDNSHKTHWPIGGRVTHPAWNPKGGECGEGKFHACSRPYFCDEFRNDAGDRYIAVRINKSDLYAWPNAEYPHKVAFRKGTVLYECDRYGNKLLEAKPKEEGR